MLRVSRLTDYATMVLAQMAREPEAVQTAADLAELTHLGRPTVSKLLKQLVRGGLLTSYRGAHGGYVLARPAEAISAAEIIDTVEGPMAVTECSLEDRQCELEDVCNVGHHWQRINRAIRSALEEVTLADLAAPASIPLRRMDLRQAVTGNARASG
ncbi:MAG: SUF system Fe-S cluster assembly regulator [Halofilum sp. (in: g-proteobacteria)]|nr:SUF system Fe-S cluster assembly regulator [Halofilum sp. (in: g-proteobacteria)]